MTVTDHNLLGLDPMTIADPYVFYEAMRHEAPVYQEPEHGVFLVSRYEDIVEISRNPAVFSNAQPTGPMMPKLEDLDARTIELLTEAMSSASQNKVTATLLSADPPVHTRYRKIISRLMNPRRARAWEPRIIEIADELIDRFIDNGRCDFVADFAHPLPLLVVGELLGAPVEDFPLLESMFGGKHAGEGIGNPKKIIERMTEALEAGSSPEGAMSYAVTGAGKGDPFNDIFRARITELRSSPVEGDLLSGLVEARDEDGVALNDDEILSIIGHFRVAGHETSTKMMTGAMLRLLTRPEQMTAVREDPELLGNMVEEALRTETPVQGLFRLAIQDTHVGGVAIPAGSLLMLVYASANRDIGQFEQPDEFDVRRENARTHLAFGQGPHFCVGAHFARAEGRLGFARLLDRTEDIALISDPDELQRNVSFVLRGIQELDISFTKAGG